MIRQVSPADAPLLLDGFARLSEGSRRSRFLAAKAQLSSAEVRHLLDVDHYDHEALAALSIADGRGVGIARYVRNREDPEAAEIAVTVVDEWQGRGLGTALAEHLTERARAAGVRRFTALLDGGNAAVHAMLHKVVAGVRLLDRYDQNLEYQIDLSQLFTGIESSATVPVKKFPGRKVLLEREGTMYTLPIAAVSARALTEQTTLSALPDAPVIDELAIAPRARFSTIRLVASRVLERAAARVAPAQCATG